MSCHSSFSASEAGALKPDAQSHAFTGLVRFGRESWTCRRPTRLRSFRKSTIKCRLKTRRKRWYTSWCTFQAGSQADSARTKGTLNGKTLKPSIGSCRVTEQPESKRPCYDPDRRGNFAVFCIRFLRSENEGIESHHKHGKAWNRV